MEDLVERVKTGFVPIDNRLPGFQQYLLVDAGDGAHLTISFYDDLSDVEQSTRDAASWAAENVTTIIDGPPEVIGGVRIYVDVDGSMATVTAP